MLRPAMAFMAKYGDSVALAKEMVSIGNNGRKKTAAAITDMDQPLQNYRKLPLKHRGDDT